MTIENANIPIKQASDRSFGIVFTVVLSGIGLYPMLAGTSPRVFFLGAAAALLCVAVFRPHWLSFPGSLWHKLGLLLGAVVAPIMLGVVYLITIVPLGLFMKIRGKKLLEQSFDADLKSYWVAREKPPQSMKKQF